MTTGTASTPRRSSSGPSRRTVPSQPRPPTLSRSGARPRLRGRQARGWLAERGWEVTAVDFSNVAIARACARAAMEQVEVDFRCADLLDFVPEREAFDLVLVLFLQLPGDERGLVLSRATAAIAPGGTFLLVGHDLENLDKGFGGPSDASLLYTPEDIVAEIPGSRSRKRSGCFDQSTARTGRPSTCSSERVVPRRLLTEADLRRGASGRRRIAPPCRRRQECLPAGRRPPAVHRSPARAPGGSRSPSHPCGHAGARRPA